MTARKRILSMILALVMMLTIVPVTAGTVYAISPPEAPSGLKQTDKGDGYVFITWNADPNAYVYQVIFTNDKNNWPSWGDFYSFKNNNITHYIGGLANDTTYYVKVRTGYKQYTPIGSFDDENGNYNIIFGNASAILEVSASKSAGNTATYTRGSDKTDGIKTYIVGTSKYNVKDNTAILDSPTKKTTKTVTVPATIKVGDKTVKVTAIAKNAFKGMDKLTTVTIGKNVKSIGARAFYGCKKLKKITIKSTKLTKKTVGSKAFTGIYKKAVVKCPKAKKAAYKKILLKKGMKKTVKFK